MKYVSIDIETTGLDKNNCQILSLAAVIEDTFVEEPLELLPKYYKVVNHKKIHGEIFAINMNKQLLEDLAGNKIPANQLVEDYTELFTGLKLFLKTHGIDKAVLSGKNVATFDLPFIQEALRETEGPVELNFHYKVLDVGPMYFDATRDNSIPSLDECLRRAGINKTVSHHALDDALDVIKCERAIRSPRVFPAEVKNMIAKLTPS